MKRWYESYPLANAEHVKIESCPNCGARMKEDRKDEHA